jgi:hypothetical protein
VQLSAAAGPWSVSPAGAAATLRTQVAAARGSGAFGMSLNASSSQPIILAGPAVDMDAGEWLLQYGGLNVN